MYYNSEDVYGVIYMITHTHSGKVYVGQTVDWERRLRTYKALRCKSQSKLYRAFVKHGIEAFTFEVVDTAVDKVQLALLEMLFIEKTNAMLSGYNCTAGGVSGKQSPETCARRSRAQKGRIITEGHRQKIRVAKLGLKATPKAIASMCKAQKGRKLSYEVRAAMCVRRKGIGNPRARKVQCVTTGNSYDCILYAHQATGANKGHISACCKGKRKSAGNLPGGIRLVWVYL